MPYIRPAIFICDTCGHIEIIDMPSDMLDIMGEVHAEYCYECSASFLQRMLAEKEKEDVQR